MYNVFSRTWWADNPEYPDGLEPCPGRKRYIKRGVKTEKEARAICAAWNSKNTPGRYSLKAEYENA